MQSISKHQMMAEMDRKTISIPLGMFLIAAIFWDSILIYPIKLFVVILHEASHGLAAIIAGGRIEGIEINESIGVVCYTSTPATFFARFLVTSAGYLGSIFWGGLILIIAARTKYDNILGMVVGGFLILLAALYIRTSFGFLFTAGFGIVLMAASYFAKNGLIDILMKFIGVTSCLYVIIDIKQDLIVRSGIGSDTDALAQLLGSRALSVPIDLLWIIIACFSLLYFLRIASKEEKRKRL